MLPITLLLTPTVDTAELARRVKQKRLAGRLSLRRAAHEIKLSTSTLSRIENDRGRPDTESLVRLSSWLGLPLESFVRGGESGSVQPVIYYPEQPLPDIVEAHLRVDRALTPDVAEAVANMFRVVYAQVSKP